MEKPRLLYFFFPFLQMRIIRGCSPLERVFGGNRNLVGIAIQLSDSEEEEFFVGYPMLISPEKFDFGIE